MKYRNLTKEQALDILGVLATVAVIGVGLSLEAKVGNSIITSIGLNLASAIIQQGSSNLKTKWLSSNLGIRHPDIQFVLTQAFVKTLNHLETEYFSLYQTDVIPKNEKESIKQLFKELKQQANQAFAASLEKAVSNQGIEGYLSATQETAVDILLGKDLLLTL